MFHSLFSFRVSLLAVLAVSVSFVTASGGPSAAGAPRQPVPFATGGPDSFGYRYVDSQEATGPTFASAWEDIASSGTVIFGANTDDSVSGAISIGFPFPFYGTDYTTAYVTSNGNMHFVSPTATYPGTTIPNPGAPNPMIAAFWADLHTGPDGDIRYSSSSTRFIVQWTSCEYYPSANDQTFFFQIKILPSGTIFISYQTMSDNGSANSTAIGIEDAAGSVGLQYCLNGSPNTVANGRVVRFADNTVPNDPTGLVQAGDAAGTARPLGYVSDSTMFFQGTVTDPDAGNQLGLEVEILPSSTAFTTNSSGTIVRTAAADMVSEGEVAEAMLDFTTAGLPSGDYHWRARAIDEGGGASNWVVFNAATIHFITDFVPPSPPGGPLTPDGIQLIFSQPAGNVPFAWGGATDTGPPGPIAYRLQISVTNTFGSTVFDSTIAAQSADVNLTAMNTPYYWRVMAVDQAGNEGSPSNTALFQVSWTTSVPDGANDRYAHCGAATESGSFLAMVLAATLALLGLISLKR